MTKVKPKVRRQMLILFCALLLFGQIFVPAAYADRALRVSVPILPMIFSRTNSPYWRNCGAARCSQAERTTTWART